jgi:deoxyhypusine synthase
MASDQPENISDHARHIQRVFERSRAVAPRPITGHETPVEILESAFPAFVGRQVRTGWELMRKCAREGHAVFLTLSGAMTPAGLHRSCIIPLIEAGLVDVLITTGANLYHDAHRVLGHAIREVAPDAGDAALREARIIRIYDLGFDEDVLLETDRFFADLMLRPDYQRPMITPKFHALLGRDLAGLEGVLEAPEPSLLATCFKAGVPIFVGAPQDGSIFLNAVKLKADRGDDFKFQLDILADVHAMAALQWETQQQGPTAVWMLGGGVPKNYTLQGEPTLSQIYGLDARGFDVDVQFCVDPVDNGALSSCPAGEGHTWGKVSAECVANSSIYVHTDVTAVLPWITYALLSEGLKRPHRRLLDQLDQAVEALHQAMKTSS